MLDMSNINFTTETEGMTDTGKLVVAIYTKLGEVAQTVANQEVVAMVKRPNSEARFQSKLAEEKLRREKAGESPMTREEIDDMMENICFNPVPTPIGNATAMFSQLQRALSENKEFQELVKNFVNESVADANAKSFKNNYDPRDDC